MNSLWLFVVILPLSLSLHSWSRLLCYHDQTGPYLRRDTKKSSTFTTNFEQNNPCLIHPNWVDSSEALDDRLDSHGVDPLYRKSIMIQESSSFLKRGNKLQSIRMRHATTRLDSHGVASRANRLPAWRIDNSWNDSCRFHRIDSNRQHFQPTLYSPPEVKIREIMIHEPVYWTTLVFSLYVFCT